MKNVDTSLVRGHVTVNCRDAETREIIDTREGDNVWTLTGREFLAQLMSYDLSGASPTAIRNDRIYYIGLGNGAQVEVASVQALSQPLAYTTGVFLKAIQSVEFPNVPATSVIFKTEFGANELSIGGNVTLREAGLYTDGDEFNHVAGQRLVALADAGDQKPCAYKNFEPLTKTTSFLLEVQWEIRFK